jgi:hypothetical protein
LNLCGLYIFILIIFSSCTEKTTTFEKNRCDSITLKNIPVYSNAGKYNNGDLIEIHGYFNYEFENIAVYLDDEFNPKNGFWVEFSRDLDSFNDNIKACNKKNIVLRGRIDNNSKGHFGKYRGTIKDVCYIKCD